METRNSAIDELRAWTIERSMPHGQVKVWEAVTDRDEMRHWSPFEVVGTRSLGAPVTVVRRHAGEPAKGHIVAFERPRLFAYAAAGRTISWEVRPDGDGGSTMRVVETLDADTPGPDEYAAWDARRVELDASLDALDAHLMRDDAIDEPMRPYLTVRDV